MKPLFYFPARSSARPSAQLLAPGRALGGCVRAGVVRDTRALPALAPEQRFNHFPAMPFVGITWMLQGEAVLVDSDGQPCDWPLPSCFVSGPQRLPFVSRNRGAIHAFSLVLFPEAFTALTGLPAACLLNRHAAMAEWLDEDWQAMAWRVAAAPSDAARMAQIETFLAPRWQARRPAGLMAALRQQLQRLGIQAASWSGWTPRHLERRSRQLFGLRPGELQRLQRAEATWQSICASEQPRLSEIALARGYADQPHMTRELRALTGSSPSRLHRQLREGNESYWVYRLHD